MPRGQERLVLAACDELAGHGDGFVLASVIDGRTGLGLRAVQDCLRGLDGDGFVDLAPLENGDMTASVTPRGRRELAKDVVGVETPIPDGHKESQITIVPKGLRSYDEHDADFFLDLLPGPRRSDGLPDSLHFWKKRIEATDPDKTFQVGLIYGPSGCGKSSLVKAGLLPRLDSHVLTVYVEATCDDTEASLLKELRKRCPNLSADLGLAEALDALGRGQAVSPGQKVLLVIDQLEQWLHANAGEEDTELVAALRDCKGEHVQAIVLVRDDFWMATNNFEARIGVVFRRDHNSSGMDLFDKLHARKVLAAFGRAYGRLEDEPTSAQGEFLDQAVEGLAQDGKVIPVRLALLVDMFRGREWTPKSLDEVGGAQGVGVAFLEETFGSRHADPRYRRHLKAVKPVLKSLMPHGLSDIKGHIRSYDELLETSGYAARPSEFEDLICILDGELHLVTPADPVGDEEGSPTQRERSYQLTHDYLVPSIREWLNRKQKETRRGRAELLLAECAVLWKAKPEFRYLPSRWDCCLIHLLTRKKDWTDAQREMMRRARTAYGLRGLGLSAVLVGLALFGLSVYAAELIQQLRNAEIAKVPQVVSSMRHLHFWIDPALKRTLKASTEGADQKLRASLALLDGGDLSQVPFLEQGLYAASSTELPVLRDALRPHSTQLTPQLWSVLGSARSGDAGLLPAASALALYDPESPSWAGVGEKVAQAFVSVNPINLGDWLKYLGDVRSKLTAPLAKLFREEQHSESERTQAANILAEYASDDPDLLADLLLDSEEKSFAILFERLKAHRERAVPLLDVELAKKTSSEATADVQDESARRHARAAVALVRLGQGERVWKLLQHSPDPSVRSYIVNWLKPLGVEPKALVARLEKADQNTMPTPINGRSRMDVILYDPETSVRRSLILALGTYGTEGLSPGEGGRLIASLLDVYRDDPDAGIHGASEWALRQWGQHEKLGAADAVLSRLGDEGRGDRRWYVNGQGQTFAVVEGPVESRMGSQAIEIESYESEHIRRRRILHRFAISAKEVTINEYTEFSRNDPRIAPIRFDRSRPSRSGPMNSMTWYEAASYCNWLSKQEGVPEGQWCYELVEGDHAKGIRIPSDFLDRRGYRLPTEAEWEYACRADTETSRFFGNSNTLLKKYASHISNNKNSPLPCGSLLPNDLGLFDTLGNVWEWCQGSFESNMPDGLTKNLIDDKVNAEIISDGTQCLLRGGGFTNIAADVRSAIRVRSQPSYRGINDGFRVARTCP